MKIAVMGSGGMGGYFGGMLARAGHDVHFIARGPHLRAMRANGLIVKTSTVGEFTIPVNATDDPSAIGPVDLVMFCVKTYGNNQAVELIKPLIGSETIVISPQNGIDCEAVLGDAIGEEHVLGCMTYLSSAIESPGVIREFLSQDVVVGEFSGVITKRLSILLDALLGAGLTARTSESISSELWSKFLWISSYSAISCVTRLPIGVIREYEDTLNLLWGALDEGIAIAHAAGIDLPDGYKESLQDRVAGAPTDHRASMYHDFAAGRPIELEDLVGVVVRLGSQYAVPTPLNFAMHAALKPYANGAPRTSS